MKKKNVIAHMTAPKEGKVHFLKRIQLLPLLLCLLAAIIIWLCVVNMVDRKVPEPVSPETEQTEEESVG